MENVKHFVFDLTCDVTGDLEVKFLNFIWKISSMPFYCRLNFSPRSVGFRDRWGADTPPPPPQQRVGSGLGPAGRGLMYHKTKTNRQANNLLIPMASIKYRSFAPSCSAPIIWNGNYLAEIKGVPNYVPKLTRALLGVWRVTHSAGGGVAPLLSR